MQAKDNGLPSLHTQTTVVITVGDENDNKPVFQGLPYSASVPEDHDTDTHILKVSDTRFLKNILRAPQSIYTAENLVSLFQLIKQRE